MVLDSPLLVAGGGGGGVCSGDGGDAEPSGGPSCGPVGSPGALARARRAAPRSDGSARARGHSRPGWGRGRAQPGRRRWRWRLLRRWRWRGRSSATSGGGGGGSSFIASTLTGTSGPTVTASAASVSITYAAPTADVTGGPLAFGTVPQGIGERRAGADGDQQRRCAALVSAGHALGRAAGRLPRQQPLPVGGGGERDLHHRGALRAGVVGARAAPVAVTRNSPAAARRSWSAGRAKPAAGPAGSNGTNGTNGTNGAAGANGADGATEPTAPTAPTEPTEPMAPTERTARTARPGPRATPAPRATRERRATRARPERRATGRGGREGRDRSGRPAGSGGSLADRDVPAGQGRARQLPGAPLGPAAGPEAPPRGSARERSRRGTWVGVGRWSAEAAEEGAGRALLAGHVRPPRRRPLRRRPEDPAALRPDAGIARRPRRSAILRGDAGLDGSSDAVPRPRAAVRRGRPPGVGHARAAPRRRRGARRPAIRSGSAFVVVVPLLVSPAPLAAAAHSLTLRFGSALIAVRAHYGGRLVVDAFMFVLVALYAVAFFSLAPRSRTWPGRWWSTRSSGRPRTTSCGLRRSGRWRAGTSAVVSAWS